MVDRPWLRDRRHSRAGNRPMTPETAQEPRLTEEAKAVIWRIFGEGASPQTGRSPYQLIEPVLRKRLSSAAAEPTIAAVRAWFESNGDRQWLKSDVNEAVATMVLEGIGAARGETEIWAVGSIDAEVTAQIIRSLWSAEEISSFVEITISLLEEFSRSDRVLDASRLHPSYSADARITIDADQRKGRLETFRQLDSHGFDVVHLALHPPAGNLLALVVELRPDRFAFLIGRLDHQGMQARAAYHMVAVSRHSENRATLRWIANGSSDALIALTIVHTLNIVNRLDDEIRLADRNDADRYPGNAETPSRPDDPDAVASGLLDGLVQQLAALDPPACARWIGELLSGAPYVLHGRSDQDVPQRISQLERACTALCARLVRESWSPDLLVELMAGLRLTPRITWIRHLADIAWEIRDVEPARARQIAGATLDEHERQIAAEIERNHAFLGWFDWHDRECYRGLGIALSMSCEQIDLPGWVRARCAPLPLSVWDAEETYEAFNTAERVVQHWFLVAFHAIPILKELGRPADPAAIRDLAENLWAHYSFAGRHVHGAPDATHVAEYASRYAIEFGEPSEAWLLEQIRNPGLGSRSIWALIDQRTKRSAREVGMQASDAEAIAAEFTRIASNRFGDGRQFGLGALYYWGLLWLLLGAIEESEKTVAAICRFPLRADDRGYKIMALKLLALAATSRPPIPALADCTAALYRELWPGYTPHDELPDRQRIDEMLERSAARIL